MRDRKDCWNWPPDMNSWTSVEVALACSVGTVTVKLVRVPARPEVGDAAATANSFRDPPTEASAVFSAEFATTGTVLLTSGTWYETLTSCG